MLIPPVSHLYKPAIQIEKIRKTVLKREDEKTLEMTEAFMTTEDIIIQMFCFVDDATKKANIEGNQELAASIFEAVSIIA
jgi:hypothetical protein